MRWKGIGEISTDKGHRVYYSGLDDKYEQGVGIIVNKIITHSVLGFQPISNRIIYLRLKASLFNVIIIGYYTYKFIPTHQIILIKTLIYFMNNFKLLYKIHSKIIY